MSDESEALEPAKGGRLSRRNALKVGVGDGDFHTQECSVEEVTGGSRPGLSRRSLIKRGAVAGGIIWTTPMIIQSAAAAQTAGCSPLQCETYYSGKYDDGGPVGTDACTLNAEAMETDGTCDPDLGPPVAATWNTPPLGAICFATVSGALVVYLNPNSAFANCHFLQVTSKKGSGTAACPIEFKNTTANCTTSVTLATTSPSHVDVWFCCP